MAGHDAIGEFRGKRINDRRGTWALAVIETQAAVDLDSSDVELHFSLAQALEYDERYDQALEQYRWITQRDADFAPAQLALGSLLYRAGANDPRRYTEARAPLERYTAENCPGDAERRFDNVVMDFPVAR